MPLLKVLRVPSSAGTLAVCRYLNVSPPQLFSLPSFSRIYPQRRPEPLATAFLQQCGSPVRAHLPFTEACLRLDQRDVGANKPDAAELEGESHRTGPFREGGTGARDNRVAADDFRAIEVHEIR